MEPTNPSVDNKPLEKETGSYKTFTGLAEDIHYLAYVRKEAQELIDDLFARKIKRREEYLNALEIELEKKDDYVVSDIGKVLEKNMPSFTRELADITKRVNDHRLLLSVLKKMKQCPVSKCIADI